MSPSAAGSGLHVPVHPVRFVTAAALFDGHDAAINIMRRILQAQGAEVVHLGHDRSVRDVVNAVLDEDAQGVAISSYQGGHVEYFEYLAELLARRGAGQVRVFGGGGGVIVAEEIERLAAGRGADLLPRGRPAAGPAGHDQRADPRLRHRPGRRPPPAEAVLAGERRALARAITCLQDGRLPEAARAALAAAAAAPVGAGAGHHRHRRLRQVVADRRAGPPVADRPAGQAADRGARGRPDPAPRRRRPARRPDPDERPRRRPRVLPLAGDPGRPTNCPTGIDGHHHRVPGGRLRPGHRGDPRHRPGRRGHHRRWPTCRCT